jgi:hypothetical protein
MRSAIAFMLTTLFAVTTLSVLLLRALLPVGFFLLLAYVVWQGLPLVLK